MSVLALAATIVVPATILTASQPSNIETVYRAGVEALASDRPFEAVELFGKVAAVDAGFQDVQLLLGQSCYLAGLTRPAKQHLERALEANPRSAQAALLLGLLLHEEQRHVEAVEVLARARELDPSSPYPSIYRGLSLLKLGRADESRTELERAVDAAPDVSPARRALSELALAQGDFETAETLLREVLASTPNDVEAKLLLGRTLFESGRSSESASLFREVVAVSPRRTEALYLLAQALLRGGDQDEGRIALARFQEQRAVDEELRVLEAAVIADKDDVGSRLRLASVLIDQGQAGRALPHVAVLLELVPRDPRVLSLAKRLENRGGSIR